MGIDFLSRQIDGTKPCETELVTHSPQSGWQSSSHRTHQLNGFRKSNPHKIVNCLFTITNSNKKLAVLTFKNHLIDTFCEIKAQDKRMPCFVSHPAQYLIQNFLIMSPRPTITPTPHTPHLTPHTPHPTPHTPRPTPHTTHLKPHTLNPDQDSGKVKQAVTPTPQTPNTPPKSQIPHPKPQTSNPKPGSNQLPIASNQRFITSNQLAITSNHIRNPTPQTPNPASNAGRGGGAAQDERMRASETAQEV
jgi:hypothetical protein